MSHSGLKATMLMVVEGRVKRAKKSPEDAEAFVRSLLASYAVIRDRIVK